MMQTKIEAGELLKTINYPEDLRKLPEEKLLQISEELRQYIIDIVSVYGGHFGASLGVIELTVALHYVFNTPYDELVWDVGHQAYGHKILTGRREVFHTNRLYKGISGFPKRKESKYDSFGVGHSSTSISAALGMAIASRLKGIQDKHHIAVIGDGAMTAGMAFEAMNHAGVDKANLLIILNDNCMSIDPNVGALKEYLTDLTTSKWYNKFRDDLWDLLGKMGKIPQKIASKIEDGLKSSILKPGMLFEALGLRYFGPIDGHNIHTLVHTLRDLKNIPGPKLLHVATVKGKGFAPAEKEQTKWHAQSSPFDKITGQSFAKKTDKPQPPKYQDVFGHTLVELAKANNKIVGITPAMPSGCSMNIMMKEIPERAFDVGICEQHAVTLSAGLATQGMIPFCNIYSSFMQRAYDQVIHDVAIQELPVIFCLDRAGVVGADGPTHHGCYDIAYFRCIPNMIIASPMNEQELRNLMYTATLNEKNAFVIRYPRGEGVMIDWKTPFEKIQIGKGRTIQEGEEIAVLTIGHIGNYVTTIQPELQENNIYIGHYDMRFVKPIDEELMHHICQKYDKIITIEDGSLMGGFGSAVLEFIADNRYKNTVKRLGIPDKIIEHGTQLELHKEMGFAPEQILETIKTMKLVEIIS